jgi:hypothetical protein
MIYQLRKDRHTRYPTKALEHTEERYRTYNSKSQECLIKNSVVDPDPMDPQYNGLLDPDMLQYSVIMDSDPYYLSKISKELQNKRKILKYFMV